MNGHNFPRELNAIGNPGDVREVVEPRAFSFAGGDKRNAWVSRYQWTTKALRSDARLLDYLRGGWTWLGRRNVGVWLLVYCGAERRSQ